MISEAWTLKPRMIRHTAWAQSNASLVRIPKELLHLLPHPFHSNLVYGWLNSTTTGDSSINDLFTRANRARFVSYSHEFDALIGPSPKWSTIDSPPGSPGAEVWFSYSGSGFSFPYNQSITSFNLRNGTSKPILTTPQVHYPYGLYYWPPDGKVYATEFNIPTQPATVVAIDPLTHDFRPIFNSYQGLPLAPCEDVVSAHVNGSDYIFATTLSGHTIIPAVPPQRFDTAVWRFGFSDKVLLPVIDSNEIFTPNGIRVSPNGKKLYVTNTPLIHNDQLEASDTTKSNSIYVYDLNDDGFPVKGRLFGLVRTGFANGKCSFSTKSYRKEA
jgi:gluconolactonase